MQQITYTLKPKPDFISSPKQLGTEACGYYVMRAMYELTTKFAEQVTMPAKIHPASRSPYSINEIEEVKGLTKEELATRNDLVAALPERIQSIPDGTAQPKQSGSWLGSGSLLTNEIKFDSDGNFESDYFQQTDESNQFRQEYEMRKMKQDEGLDIISEGLDTLKNMAHDMNEVNIALHFC